MLALAPLAAETTTKSASLKLRFLASTSTGSGDITIGFTSKDVSTVQDIDSSEIIEQSPSKTITKGLKAFDTILDSTKTFIITEDTTHTTTMGYISYYSTALSGGKIGIKATKLFSSTDSTANPHTIDYILYVNGNEYDTAQASPSDIALTIATSGSTSTPIYGSFPVAFQPNATSFASAPKDDYIGKISVSLTLN